MLKLKSIAFQYSGRDDILKDISLSIDGGQIGVILGPNGSGKSTLLDICLGWSPPKLGSIQVNGRNLTDLSPKERGKLIGLVPQRENIRFDFSVFDYILLGRAPRLPSLGMPGMQDFQIAETALHTVGIENTRNSSIATLSGGEYQLMLIARSLVQEPKLLLLDEPTSQLDPANRVKVMRLLRKLASMGITILFTSHSPETAAMVAGTVYLLRDGVISAGGPPKEILIKENLEDLYGMPIVVSWSGEYPHFHWDLSDRI
mgnify:CR=1 FL=1